MSNRLFKRFSLLLVIFKEKLEIIFWIQRKFDGVFFIIKGFRTIVFIFIVISTMFRSICPPAFFRCLSNPGTFTELRTTSFIESTGVACSDSVSHNQVQVLSIPVLLLACSQDWEAGVRTAAALWNACLQDLFNTTRSILVQLPSSFPSIRLVSVYVVHLYILSSFLRSFLHTIRISSNSNNLCIVV